MLTLAEIQRRFSDALDKDSLAVLDSAFSTAIETSSVPFSKRFGTYHYAYAARIGDSLKEDFEAICRWIGEESFDQIVRPFLRSFPSTYHSIAEISRHFPEFLESVQHPEDPQFLPAIAHLEWAMVCASVARATPEAEVQPLANLAEAPLDQVVLALNPSLVCFTSEWPVDKLLYPRGQLAFREAVRIAVFRNSSGIQLKRFRSRQWELLLLMEQNVPADRILHYAQEARVSAEQIQSWFSKWAEWELIQGFKNLGLSAGE
jgi:hypothetical protein